MNKDQGVFKRYEKKYLLDEKQYVMLRQRLKELMEVDQYGKTTICNIYFDTPDYYLIRKSIEKPIYKEKLRLRSYGVPKGDSKAFIELKKKYEGIVYKRRVSMTLKEAADYLYDKKQLRNQSQITEEIDWFMDYYKGIEPAMYIAYNRIALYNRKNKDLRVTFDSNIIWREEDLDLTKGFWGESLLEPNQRLMEIKIPGAMPVWLAKELDTLKIYPSSYSKYGNGYKTKIKRERQKMGGIHCA